MDRRRRKDMTDEKIKMQNKLPAKEGYATRLPAGQRRRSVNLKDVVMGLRNILSVDVEDYFHVEAFSDVVGRDTWDGYSCRVEANTLRLLDLFDRCDVKSTCFILGWVAERYPGLVREIVSRGHEPACHSYWHRLIYKLSPEEYRE